MKVAKVAKSLIENGYVEGRPQAGITIIDLTDPSTAMQYGATITGVYIKDVTGKNAKKAGLKSGDLIYYVDETKITSSAQLVAEQTVTGARIRLLFCYCHILRINVFWKIHAC